MVAGGAPQLLSQKEGSYKYPQEIIRITTFSWSDEGQKVKIYIPMAAESVVLKQEVQSLEIQLSI